MCPHLRRCANYTQTTTNLGVNTRAPTRYELDRSCLCWGIRSGVRMVVVVVCPSAVCVYSVTHMKERESVAIGSVREYVRAHYRNGWRLRRRVIESFALVNELTIDDDIADLLVARECACAGCAMFVDEWKVLNGVA